jgi:RNA-splicing ligase RtcB
VRHTLPAARLDVLYDDRTTPASSKSTSSAASGENYSRTAGILSRSRLLGGLAEEAPGAVAAVVAATDEAGLARKVARLVPLLSIKG